MHTAMRAQPAASAEAIFAADVFIYMGDLAPLFRECWRVLKPGGIFIATFEDALATSDTWKLEHSGRYTHALPYLQEIANEAGFTETISSPIVLR